MRERATTIAELIARNVLMMSDGYRTKRSEHGQPGYRIIRVADVLDGTVKLDSPDFVSENFQRTIGAKAGRAGDILLTTKGTVGRVAVLPPAAEPVVYSPQLCFFRVTNPDVLDPCYLRYWFKSEEFWHQASDRMNNTDMAAYINLADIRSLALTLPSAAEQRAIAEVLGALDDKIAANTRLAATVDELLASDFISLGIDAEPEATARTVLLDQMIELNPPVRRPTEAKPVYVDMQKLPVAGMSISAWERRPAKGGVRFENGDTLLARITPCLQNRKTGYVDFLESGQVGIGSTEYIVMRSRPGIPSELTYFLAISERFRSFAIRHMVGTSGRQRVSASDLRSFVLSEPDPSSLESFGKKAESLFAIVKSQRDENRMLAAVRDTLLPQLMSEKLRVKDAEKAVGGVL